jgi:hypothetical protein
MREERLGLLLQNRIRLRIQQAEIEATGLQPTSDLRPPTSAFHLSPFDFDRPPSHPANTPPRCEASPRPPGPASSRSTSCRSLRSPAQILHIPRSAFRIPTCLPPFFGAPPSHAVAPAKAGPPSYSGSPRSAFGISNSAFGSIATARRRK